MIPTDGFAAANFLARHLYRPIAPTGGESLHAVSETKDPVGGDIWFWTDDNAKVLEFLSRPDLWQRFPRETAEILSFVRSMCQGPFIFRRVSSPRLEKGKTEGSVEEYLHSLMRVKYDLSNGFVGIGMRFHDERSANILLAGNRVEFTYRGLRFRIAVAPRIEEIGATQDGPLLRLRHAADLHFSYLLQRRRLGRIAYIHTFDARSMIFEAEVALELDPGITVSDVVLTIGHDGLAPSDSRDGPSAADFTLVVDTLGGGSPMLATQFPAVSTIDAAGASYYAIAQSFTSGDSIAVHSIPSGPTRVSAIETHVHNRTCFRRIIARYNFSGPRRGERLVAAERKLLTYGGFYERIADYAGFIREAAAARSAHAVRDLSISYDYGVVINAFAKCFAASAGPTAVPEAPALREELRALFDRYVDHYFAFYIDRHRQRPNAIFSRELSFVILGLLTMYRATEAQDYLRRVARLVEILLGFELRFADVAGNPASGFLMRMDSPRAAYVDCHSAALLALTQAARFLDDPRLPAVIDRGLASFCLETRSVDSNGPLKIDTVSVLMVDENGGRHLENAYWNFKVGMALRFFNALRSSPHRALQAVAARHRNRIELFETIMRMQLANSIAAGEDTVEIRTAVTASETNSETQPWVMMGLLGHPWD